MFPVFKDTLVENFACLNPQQASFSFSRCASIYHTHLRLGLSCLREYLFKINHCAPVPVSGTRFCHAHVFASVFLRVAILYCNSARVLDLLIKLLAVHHFFASAV